jgi:hypothetical protein
MIENMGGADAAIWLGIVAVALLLTSLSDSCPGYLSFRFSTRRSKQG